MRSDDKYSFLGIAAYSLLILGLLSMTKKSKRHTEPNTQQSSSKENHTCQENITISPGQLDLILRHFPENTDNSKNKTSDSIIWTYIKRAAIVAGILIAVANFLLWFDTNRNFALDQRPWVGPVDIATDIRAGVNPTADIAVKNTGKNPAFDLRAETLIDSAATGTFQPIWRTRPIIERVGNLFPGGTIHIQMEDTNPISKDMFESAFTTGITSIYVYSFLTYRDGLGKTHQTEICFRHDSTYPKDTNAWCPEGYNFAN